MKDKNVRVNSLAGNPTLVALAEQAKPYVEAKRKERQMMLAVLRDRRAKREGVSPMVVVK